MKFFNTSGPVNPKKHYCLTHRLNEQVLRSLIEQEKYFILHAPRQSGKTTSIMNFVKMLNDEGKYKALYINIEAAQASRSRVIEGMFSIIKRFEMALSLTFGNDYKILQYFRSKSNTTDISGEELAAFLQFWAQNEHLPIVLFIDEIDSLVGDTLISVLRQIRAGYANRPDAFPQTVCLVGVRDVRDYRIWSDEQQASILGGSAFNIKAESLTLPNFTQEQVRDLYLQHTQETGQKFTDEAIEYAFYLTQGQPWLVNALAYQACFKDIIDRSKPIPKEAIESAKETLIQRRDTHIDVLIDRLSEPRVRKIVEPILLGQTLPSNISQDDISYVKDLGLLTVKNKDLVISNPIYQEILPRELVCVTQAGMTEKTAWYVDPDGSINMQKLFDAFTQFFREHSDAWIEKFDYKEAGPHLLLMAFLQRIINGGGKIHREYALGRKRMDLRIDWQKQVIVIELKLWYGEKALSDGIKQTAEYMDTCNATEGHLVIFDQSKSKTWDERIYHRQENFAGKLINIWGM